MTDWIDSVDDMDAVHTSTAAFGELVTLPDGSEVLGIFEPAPDGSVGHRDHDYGGDQFAPPTLMLPSALAEPLRETELITARGQPYAISRIDRGGRSVDLVTLILRPVRTS